MSPTPLASRLTVPRKLAYTALVLLCLVLAGELLLRLINPEIFEFVYTARQLHGYTTWHKVDLHPSTRGELRLTRRDGSELFDFTVTVDAHGTRHHTLAADPPGRRHVVHCLGDSYTMGWGVEDDEAYPAQLASLLGPSHAVVNLGVDGYGLLAAVEKSRRVAAWAPPDTLVYVFCENDLHDDTITRRVSGRSNLDHAPWFALDGLRRLSYLANVPFALKWAAHFAPALEGTPSGVSFPQLQGDELAAALASSPLPDNDTSAALLDLAARCALDDLDLRFVAVDTAPTTLGFVRLCQSQGIRHLLLPLDDGYRIPGDGHLDVEGNRLLARQLARVLVSPVVP